MEVQVLRLPLSCSTTTEDDKRAALQGVVVHLWQQNRNRQLSSPGDSPRVPHTAPLRMPSLSSAENRCPVYGKISALVILQLSYSNFLEFDIEIPHVL